MCKRVITIINLKMFSPPSQTNMAITFGFNLKISHSDDKQAFGIIYGSVPHGPTLEFVLESIYKVLCSCVALF